MRKNYFKKILQRTCGTISRNVVLSFQLLTLFMGIQLSLGTLLFGVYLTQEVGGQYGDLKIFIYSTAPLLIAFVCYAFFAFTRTATRLYDEVEGTLCR